MNIILDDTRAKAALYPFTATRHSADIRIGIQTIRDKWHRFPGFKVYADEAAFNTAHPAAGEKAVRVDAGIIPTKSFTDSLFSAATQAGIAADENYTRLDYPWQISQFNDYELRADFIAITTGRASQLISSTNRVSGSQDIFVEEGASIEHSILNANTGPIYIGKNARVQEGCLIRGPFALCEGAVLKMGAKIYGASTIGPYSTAAGEIKNSVIFGYSNKAHDGYLGDSVLGEWCNLGAGTTNSNVKNTAGTVKVWNNATGKYLPVGLKAGLLMGDYSRSAINTSFNTGTVVGVCCNIFGNSFPPKFVPDFSWGQERYAFEKVLADINNWKQLKGKAITPEEQAILHQLYNQ